jgi:prepilin-type N-terminal cleavage/methylation domain-containing protein
MSFSPENQEPRARRGAFTLIELLAVVAVIAILTALLIPVVSSMITRAQSSADLSNLRQLHHAFFLAGQENDGIAPMAAVPEARHKQHWPGRLAPYLELEFPPGEYTVYLDYPSLPEKTPLTSPGVDPIAPSGRKFVTYGMNHHATGTYWKSAFHGALRSDGSHLDIPARLHLISPRAILFADTAHVWHVGEGVLRHAGEDYDPAIHNSSSLVYLNFPYNGKANFIRADGSAFSSGSIPERSAWTIDGDAD